MKTTDQCAECGGGGKRGHQIKCVSGARAARTASALVAPVPTSVSLSADLLAEIDRWAKQRDLSRTAAIAEMLERYQAIVTAPPIGVDQKIKAQLVAWLATNRWRARDLLCMDLLARRALGDRIGDKVIMMPTGLVAALVDESERDR